MKSNTSPRPRSESSPNGHANSSATTSNRSPEPLTPARVVIVEDEEGVRISLKVIVESRGEFVCTGLFANAETALSTLPALNPDLVLMDINLPGMSGIECLQHIKDVLPTVRVVMVSALDDKATVQAAARAGCLDFVTKPFDIPQLMTILYLAMSRQPAKSASGPWMERWEKLTEHERMLVRLIARGKKNKEIADQFGVSERTIAWEIHTILDKLNVHSRSGTVSYLYWNEGGDNVPIS